MKRFLSGIIIAPITFFIGFYAAAYLALYHLPETTHQLSPADKKYKEVRPALNQQYQWLTDRARVGLRGPVKLVREELADFMYREGNFNRIKDEDEPIVYRSLTYAVNGALLSSTFLPECGNSDPTRQVYDDRGFLIEKIDFMNRDEADRRIRSRIVYKYDEQGNMTELYQYDSEGKLTGKTIYKYKLDAHGNWTEQIPLFSERTLSSGERVDGHYRIITYYKK
jgi:hypothetical protein